MRAFPVCYSDKRFVNSRPKTNILFENRNIKGFEIVEHLLQLGLHIVQMLKATFQGL